MNDIQRLLFVYNADAGLVNMVADAAHKIFSPSTYACNLCKITYGNVFMKKQWKKYIASLPMEVVFLHKDELKKKYPRLTDTPLPAAFAISKTGEESVAISAEEMNRISSISELIALVEKART